MNKAILISLTIGCILLAGCQSAEKPAIDTEADIKAIQNIYLPCSKVAAGDLEGWLSDFHEDAVYMPLNMPTLRGNNAIRQWAIETFGDWDMTETIEIEKIGISGDLAYVLFTYAFSADPRSGGEQVNDAGRIINILERQNDGSWKIRYHLSNSTWNLQGTAIE